MVGIFGQEKRCRVVWLCDLHSGHAGVGYVLGSIALRYVISIGDLPARNCAKVRLVLRDRVCSDLLMSGAGCDKMEFDLYESRHSLTAIVCIVLRFIDIVSEVGEMVSLILIVFPLHLSKTVGFILLGQFACWVSSCKGCVGSLAFCLSCDAWSLR